MNTSSGGSGQRLDNLFVERHGPGIRAQAVWLCRGGFDPDDLVQDTFVYALSTAPQFNDDTHARAWLGRVLRNKFLDSCRHEVASPIGPLVPSNPDHDPRAPEPYSEVFWEHVTLADLERSVGNLRPKLRVTYELHLQGIKNRDIAERLDLPAATVGTQLFQARKKLKELLMAAVAKRGGMS